jgi:regulator of sigma E protease
VPFSDAVDISVDSFWLVTQETLKLPAKLFVKEEREQLSGVVGSYETTRQSILERPRDAIAILALISLSLAIVNLFPFLPLDGGHIFWAVVELIRRKPVSLQVMERSGVIGFALVMVIFVIGLSNDIGRLSGDGFSVR